MPKMHELLAVGDDIKGQATKTRTDLQATFTNKQHHFRKKIVTFQSVDACSEARSWFRDNWGAGPVPVLTMLHQVISDAFSNGSAYLEWVSWYLTNIPDPDVTTKASGIAFEFNREVAATADGVMTEEEREKKLHEKLDKLFNHPATPPRFQVNNVDGLTVVDERQEDGSRRPFCQVYGDAMTADHNAKRIAQLLNGR